MINFTPKGSKRILLSNEEIELVIEALKYDRERNGDDHKKTKESLENDLKIMVRRVL